MSFLARLFGGGSPSIQPADYKARFMDGKQPHTLIDVRTADEFKSGHVAGSINISVDQLNDKLNKIAKDKPVIVYCQSGSRSSHAARTLLAAGYTEVYDMGSISGCQRQGLPVVR